MGGAMLLTGQGLRWLHGLPLLLLTPVAVAAQTPAPQSSAAPAVAGVLRVVPVVQGGNLRLALSRPLPAPSFPPLTAPVFCAPTPVWRQRRWNASRRSSSFVPCGTATGSAC